MLDEAGDFDKRCNAQMVEIERIEPEGASPAQDMDAAMADVLSGDEARLRFLIERYMKFTNSSRARAILDSWDVYLPKFVKIMPVDYRRALLDMRAGENQDPINLAAGE